MDGSCWELFGEKYHTNPRFLLGPGDVDMINLWRLFQGGGMGGGHLPDSGGVIDQPAIMMDAFTIMDKAERELKNATGRETRR